MVSFAIVMLAAIVVGNGNDAALTLAAEIAQFAQIPFVVVTSLIGVLMVAVPALYYERGDVVTIKDAVRLLMGNIGRYLLAGVLFTTVMAAGFLLCALPGIAVALVAPVYVNCIFVTNMTIGDSFSHAFQVVYRSENGIGFVVEELIVAVGAGVATVLTCGLGGLVFVPMASFYVQNLAYKRGLLR